MIKTVPRWFFDDLKYAESSLESASEAAPTMWFEMVCRNPACVCDVSRSRSCTFLNEGERRATRANAPTAPRRIQMPELDRVDDLVGCEVETFL